MQQNNQPVYGLSLIPDGAGGFLAASPPLPQKSFAGGGGSGGFSLPQGSGFTDVFKKDRAPTPVQLVRELVGLAWSCACLNANLIASLKLRLYVRTRRGQGKTKFASAYERRRGYAPTAPVPPRRLKYLEATGKVAPSAGTRGTGGYTTGEADLIEEVVDHPLLDLLNHPETADEDMGLSGFDHRWSTQLYMESIGRAYWLIEWDEMLVDTPRRLWLMHGQFMKEFPEPEKSRDGGGGGYGVTYEYAVGNHRERYDARDIVKIHMPDLAHLRLGGFAPLMAAYEKLQLIRKGDAQINSILENMGFPGLIATPKPSEAGTYFGVNEARRMQSSLNALLRQGGYGGTVVLPEPLELIFPNWKPNETLSLDRYQQYKEDIANCFDTPTSVLRRNDSNLASAKTGDYAHAKYAGVPRAARYETVVNTRLVPLYEDGGGGDGGRDGPGGKGNQRGRLFVAFDNVIPDDELFDLEQHKSGVAIGAFTINEFRRACGLAELEDAALGDKRYINGQLIGPDGVPIMAVQQDGGKSDRANNEKADALEKRYAYLQGCLDERARQVKAAADALPAETSAALAGPTDPERVEPARWLHGVAEKWGAGGGAGGEDTVAQLSQTVRQLTRTVENVVKLVKPSLSIPPANGNGRGAHEHDRDAPPDPHQPGHRTPGSPADDLVRVTDAAGHRLGDGGAARVDGTSPALPPVPVAGDGEGGAEAGGAVDERVKAVLRGAGYSEDEIIALRAAEASAAAEGVL